MLERKVVHQQVSDVVSPWRAKIYLHELQTLSPVTRKLQACSCMQGCTTWLQAIPCLLVHPGLVPFIIVVFLNVSGAMRPQVLGQRRHWATNASASDFHAGGPGLEGLVPCAGQYVD